MTVTVVLLVTGSRFWDDIWSIKNQMDRAAEEAAEAGADRLIVRHGACYPPVSEELGRRPYRSADYLVHLWCQIHGPTQPVEIVEQARPADWEGPCRAACQSKTHRSRTVNHRTARGTCPMAGHHRNRDMVLEDPRPDAGLAFQRDNSSGTDHCRTTMREFGIPVDDVPYEQPPAGYITRRCGTEREPDGKPCTGVLTFEPGVPQARCPKCRGWTGRHAPTTRSPR